MHMKGVSLPINTVIILMLGALVFGALVLFFTGGSRDTSNALSLEKAYASGCNTLFYSRNCDPNVRPEQINIQGFNPDGSAPNGATLARACEMKFSWNQHDADGAPAAESKSLECKKSCSCSK